MAATQIGTGTLTAAGQPTITGYIVESWDTGGGSPEIEDVKDALGAQHTRLVFEKRRIKVSGVLLVTSATWTTDFPEGAMCTIAAWNTYFVDSAVAATTKGVTRVTVSMTKVTTLG